MANPPEKTKGPGQGPLPGSESNEALAKASQEFEALVVGELLKTMRKTISTGSKQGFDAQVTTGMFDEELAKHIASAGAFGIANVMTTAIGEHETPTHGGLSASDDWTLPVDSAPARFAEGQRFGAERLGHEHQGLDIAEPVGAPVHAARAGIISGIGNNVESSGGLQVKITHDDGYVTKYMHLDSIAPGLSVGQEVNAGEDLGTVGDTGTSSHGAHLHFELEHNGTHINPEPFVKTWKRP